MMVHKEQRLPIADEALLAVDDALAFPPGLHEKLGVENAPSLNLLGRNFDRPLNPFD
jgi:hypothetical protein